MTVPAQGDGAGRCDGPYLGDPVQDQLEAYNRGDIEAFLRCYAADAVVSDATGGVLMRGQEQMRERYTRRLASPGLHATVVQRMVAGDWTVDHEILTGFDGGDAEAVVAFRTDEGNRIEQVVFLAREAARPDAGRPADPAA